MPQSQLFYGDNLPVLRDYIASESVDLVYLDPPFNSNRNYSVIFGEHVRKDTDANAQIQAFDDTWRWDAETERLFRDIQINAPNAVGDALQAFRSLVGESDALAYLVMMAPRLVELHRTLKAAGSLVLHCDPTMSHYLKVLLDAIFGPDCFQNEIIWKRTRTKGDARRKLGRNHDVLLMYSRGKTPTFNRLHSAHSVEYKTTFKYDDSDGRGLYASAPLDSPNPRPNLTYEYKGYAPPAKGWRVSREEMERLDAEGRLIFPIKKTGRIRRKLYASEQPGVPLDDVWTDIPPISSHAAERLGYPTQKPLPLLERIIKMTTDEGDVVLDPFCGCGTTVDAAQKLGRSWIGVDITYISIDLIIKRLQATFGQSVMDDVTVDGIPFDMQSAQRLFEKSPFDFERWAVAMLHAQPNEKQVGDKGIDGTRRFIIDQQTTGKVLVSVKGGKTVPPTHVRDLVGTVHNRRDAQLGVLITLNDELTRGSQEVIDTSGYWTHPANGQHFPVLQHVSIRSLLEGARPNLPTALAPYISAKRGIELVDQGKLFG